MEEESEKQTIKNLSSSLTTFGSWATSHVKTVAAAVETAAAVGKQAVESKLQELIESDSEDDRPPLRPQDGPLAQAILAGEIPYVAAANADETSGAVEEKSSELAVDAEPPTEPAALNVESELPTAVEAPPACPEEARSSSMETTEPVPKADSPASSQPLSEDVEQLVGTTTRLSTQVVELESWVKMLQEERDNLVEGYQKLESECRQEKQTSQALQAKLKSMTIEIQTTSTQFGLKSKELEEAQARLKESEALVKSMIAEVSAERAAQEQKQKQLETQMKAATAEHQRLQLTLISKEKEIEELQVRLHAAVAEYQDDSSCTSKELMKYKTQIDVLNDRLSIEQTEKRELAQQLEQIDELRRALGMEADWLKNVRTFTSETQSKLDAVQAENARLRDTNRSMVDKCHALQVRVAELEALEHHRPPPEHVQVQQQKQQVDAVMALEARLAAKSERLDTLFAENHALRAQLSNYQAVNSSVASAARSPFIHVEAEFQKTAFVPLVLKPILRFLGKFVFGREWRLRTEEQCKRAYASALNNKVMDVINNSMRRLLVYKDAPIIIALFLMILLVIF